MRDAASLWRSEDCKRWFLVPDTVAPPTGLVPIRSLFGESAVIDSVWLTAFEVTEDQARRWAKDQLGQTLEELKSGIDEKLADLRRQLDEKNRTPVTEHTTVTPNAGPALFELLKKLPRVIGNSLSGDEKRVESAKTAMARLQRQLKEAGIDLDDRFTNFPDRLAELRKEPSSKPD
jgi:hypothetical protein